MAGGEYKMYVRVILYSYPQNVEAARRFED